jgi:hypothetical protein
MPLYTFYPCRDDGGADTFVSLELPDDAQAAEHAAEVLGLHPSATCVEVWAGEARVHVEGRRRRAEAG